MPVKDRRARARPAKAPAPLPDGIDGAPAERWQHGEVLQLPVARRDPTRVRSGVDILREAKAIDDPEVAAAERFEKDYLFGIEGVRGPSTGAAAGDPHVVQLARIVAVTRHREIADAIGPKMTAWLVSFVVLKLSFVAMQAKFMPGPLAGRTEMRGRMTVLLLLLSRLYAAIDKRRKGENSSASLDLL